MNLNVFSIYYLLSSVIPPRLPSTRITRPCRTLPSKPYAASFLWHAPRLIGTRSWATRLARRCRMLKNNGEHNRHPPPPHPPPLPNNVAWLDSCIVFVQKLEKQGQRKVWSHSKMSNYTLDVYFCWKFFFFGFIQMPLTPLYIEYMVIMIIVFGKI